MSFQTVIHLLTGQLQVSIQADTQTVEHYLGFAARNNPKRGFLFVSKVLGKHYPCKPSVMLQSYQKLVNLLNPLLANSEKIVFMGMAETATALGLGIYQQWLLHNTSQSTIYCQTTRYFLADYDYLPFEESHSHQTDFYLYFPVDSLLKNIFNHADTLVLIDDEISTGNTFANLINAYRNSNPYLRQVIIVSLLNVATEEARQRVADLTQIPIDWLSLLNGNYHFQSNPDFQFNPIVNSTIKSCKKQLLSVSYGRLGLNQLITPPIQKLLAITKHWKASDKILVLGTGEFIYPAYLIGLFLEQQGYQVWVQSTTRSPILLGETIKDIISFKDNYAENITNYLYNFNLNHYDQVLICHETPTNQELTDLLALFNATSFLFSE